MNTFWYILCCLSNILATTKFHNDGDRPPELHFNGTPRTIEKCKETFLRKLGPATGLLRQMNGFEMSLAITSVLNTLYHFF
jgi:hypothetical protein